MLQKELDYEYSEFTFKQDFSKDYGKGILQEESVEEGLAILSKIRFNSQKIDLPIIKRKDRWPRIVVKYSFEGFTLCNIHFSKLRESREQAVKHLPEADIYASDFNMQPDELKKYFQYSNSFEKKNYFSYPSKELTLDYVLAKTGILKSIEIINNISDHNALFVEWEKQ